MPASTLPSVAKNKFCCGFLPGSSRGLSQGQTDPVQQTASTAAADFPPLPPLSCLGGFLVPSRASISTCISQLQIPLTQSLSVSFHVLPSCACSPFTGNLSSRVVPVTYCFQAVSYRTSPGGCIGSPAPLQTPCVVPQCCLPAYGSRLGFPRFPLEVTIPTPVRLSPSFFWRLRLSFECQSGRKGNVRRDSTGCNGFSFASLSGPRKSLAPICSQF